MRYETVIFDMDGTILETLEDIADSVNVTMDHVGYPRRTLDEVRSFVGNGVAKLIERCVPQGENDPQFTRALDFYKQWYADHAQVKTGPYPGIAGLLDELKRRGVKIAVVSNKPDGSVKDLCEFYFPGVFPVAIGDRAEWRKKPAPDSVFEAMRALNARAETTVYVGDSEVDVSTAANAGLDCITVTWGFRDEGELRQYGAKLFAHTARELLDLL